MTSTSSVSSSTSSTSATTTSTSTSTSNSSSVNRNGFDTTSLVEAAVTAKLSREDAYNTKIQSNSDKITAYQQMQTLLQTLDTKLAALRGATGGTSSTSDVFANRSAYLTSSDSVDASTILSATVDDSTKVGKHSVEVTQIAKAAKLGSSTVSDRSTALGYSGSFTLGLADGSTKSISVDSDMTLDDIADAINVENATTGVTASVVKVSDSEYELVLSGDSTGKDLTLSDDSGGVLQSLGVLDSSGAAANQLQAAQNAKLTVDGIAIERSGNDISDALDGITLHLYRADEGNSMTLEVAQDLSAIKTAVSDFVDAYNAYRDFVITNQKTSSSGGKDSDAVLFGDSTLRSVTHSLADMISGSVGGTSLADLGITLDSDNKLSLDETTLENELTNAPDAVQTLFAYQFQSSSGDVKMLRHGDGPKDASFTLNITVDADGNLSGADVDGDSSLFTVSGSTITGAAGSAYDGLVLVYTGTSSQSVSLTVTQGIADQMYQSASAAADADTGSLTSLISGLEDANSDLQDRVSLIESQAETYRTYLLTMYSRMESQINTNESNVTLLKSLLSSDSSSSSS